MASGRWRDLYRCRSSLPRQAPIERRTIDVEAAGDLGHRLAGIVPAERLRALVGRQGRRPTELDGAGNDEAALELGRGARDTAAS
jgi:hypothetical protein